MMDQTMPMKSVGMQINRLSLSTSQVDQKDDDGPNYAYEIRRHADK